MLLNYSDKYLLIIQTSICAQVYLPVILLSPTEHLSFIQAADHTKKLVLLYSMHFKLVIPKCTELAMP